MLQAAIAGFFVWLIIKFLERGNEDNFIDGWTSFIFVLVPALMIFLISLGVGIAGLSQVIVLLAVSLYFIVPCLMLKFQFDFKWGKACGYAAMVFGVSIATELGLTYGLAALSA